MPDHHLFTKMDLRRALEIAVAITKIFYNSIKDLNNLLKIFWIKNVINKHFILDSYMTIKNQNFANII